jgi:hypothetical protein
MLGDNLIYPLAHCRFYFKLYLLLHIMLCWVLPFLKASMHAVCDEQSTPVAECKMCPFTVVVKLVVKSV